MPSSLAVMSLSSRKMTYRLSPTRHSKALRTHRALQKLMSVSTGAGCVHPQHRSTKPQVGLSRNPALALPAGRSPTPSAGSSPSPLRSAPSYWLKARTLERKMFTLVRGVTTLHPFFGNSKAPVRCTDADALQRRTNKRELGVSAASNQSLAGPQVLHIHHPHGDPGCPVFPFSPICPSLLLPPSIVVQKPAACYLCIRSFSGIEIKRRIEDVLETWVIRSDRHFSHHDGPHGSHKRSLILQRPRILQA